MHSIAHKLKSYVRRKKILLLQPVKLVFIMVQLAHNEPDLRSDLT